MNIKGGDDMLKKICMLLIPLIIFSACDNNANKDNDIVYMHGEFVVNVDDLEAMTGFSDYVFVGYVEERGETIKAEKDYLENGKEIYTPYTPYKLTVIDNIKGNLKKNAEIEILKHGGYLADGRFEMWEDDIMPEEGEYYIFHATVNTEGMIVKGLVVSGPNTNIKLDVNKKSDIVSSKEYKEYKKAFQNQKPYNRERCLSEYDVNYKGETECKTIDY